MPTGREPKGLPPSPKRRFSLLYVLLIFWGFILINDLIRTGRNVQMVPYSEFIENVDRKQISEVSVGGTEIRGTLKNPPSGRSKEFVTLKMEDPTLTDRLEQAGVARFGAVYENTFFRDMLSWIVPAIVMLGLWWLLISRMSGGARPDVLSLGKSKARVFVERDLKVRFSDVAGVEEAKAELREVVEFLKNPKQYSALGGRMPKGVLLVGPPGTGKTLLARAVAGEAGVPYFSINGSEFVEMFVGLGAARVRDLFNQARAQSPCIVFIDELDALGRARGINAISGGGNDEKEQTLNQLLAELDGFDSSTGVILLGATNRPEVLDPALLRAGRFDRQVLVDKPDRVGRRAILEVHLKKIRASLGINVEVIASLTAGFSGADLANLVNEAALIATRRRALAVEPRDFTEAIEKIVAGLERKTRLLGPEERKKVAYHEMGHATVALALGKGEVVHKVTIIPRGLGALGYTFRRPTEDRYLMDRRELDNKMAMLLGGRVAEMQFFDDITTGAADDLDKATEIARAMVTRYGMSGNLGFATFEKDPAPLLGPAALVSRGANYSESTAQAIDQEVRQILDHSVEIAKKCLQRYHAFVDEAAQVLLAKETLEEAELKELWELHRQSGERPLRVA